MAVINEKFESLNYVDKFILLLLAAKNYESIPSSLHLQKEMYLLQNLFAELADETDYEPYFIGPYSEIVDNEIDELVSSNLINRRSGRLELTSESKQILHKFAKEPINEKMNKIEEFKVLLNDLTNNELLAFIYFSYPSDDLAKESIEYKDLLPKRKNLAMSMYNKNKISVQKAAQIAGEDLEDFIQGFNV